MRIILSIINLLFIYFSCLAQENKQTLSAYNNQLEITAFESVVLQPGFHVSSGKNVRIFIAPSTPSNRILSSAPSSNRSFILERSFKVAGVRLNTLSDSRNLAEESQRVTYFDNLGRAIQTNNVMASNSYRDVITAIRYDNQGLNSTVYMPYADQASSDGSFKTDDLERQLAFYSSTGWDPLVAKTTAPFSKAIYDTTPESKVTQQGSVGTAWQPDGRTLRFEELFNNDVDFANVASTRKVRKFTVNSQDTSVVSMPTSAGYYAVGELNVYISKNNNWAASDGRLNTAEKYVDKRGQTVLERSFVKNDSGALLMLSTYYVYSDLGELYFILPPILNPDVATLNAAALDMYAVRNTYDKKRRLVQKKEPGVAATYYIYNSKDQLVASQNANQKAKSQWSFTKYDSQGRTILNGVFISTLSYYKLRDNAQAATNTYESVTVLGQGYSNVAWPTTGISSYSFINYYDDYDVVGLPSVMGYTANGQGAMVTYPTGRATVRKTWLADNDNSVLWTVSYYDKYGQVIQVKSTNHLGGVDQIDNNYNFAGELVSYVRSHSGPNSQQLTATTSYEYDQSGRKRSVRQRIDGQEEITLAEYSYNELGELIDKKLHKKASSNKFLQSVDYRYNEKGWLTSINDPNLVKISGMNDGDESSDSDLFGMQFLYNTDSQAPQYGGNIASMRWKTSRVGSQSVAPPKMGYQFRYDGLNQIIAAIAERDDVIDNSHSEFVKYDFGGNITNLGRYAFTSNSKQQIDSLVYIYDGYRTKKIDDVSASSSKMLGYNDKVKLSVEYFYDNNGNVIEDKNKDIRIVYNDLNLATQVNFGPNHNLDLLYDKTGEKLQAKYSNGTSSFTIDYINGIQYQQGQIVFIQTDEGRARKNGNSYVFEYDINDHLGNKRITFIPNPTDLTQSTAKVVQQNSYYPYGMTMYGDGQNGFHLAYVDGEKNKYLYSGKELYDQGDLNWYDHGARMYDPAIGRWSVMDPATQFINPYLAMGNNPVVYVDPDGQFAPLVPVIVGAVIGGAVNTIAHWEEIQAQGWIAGLKAFGVGAFAGGLSVATGGAATGGLVFSSSAVSVAVVAGAVGGVYGDMALGVGNMLAFGDPYDMSAERLVKTAVISGATAGLTQGLGNVIKGTNFWTGRPTVFAEQPIQTGLKGDNGKIEQPSSAFQEADPGPNYLNSNAANGVGQLGFKEVQALTKTYSTELNTFFKSGGTKIASKDALLSYKELATRILNGTGGAPATKLTETALKVQSQRLEMINKALEIMN
ncbi:RHS repeat domain-containing protein [Sphingobacterium sp. LRF_L2]|uniref:RHS repeat domain-containing protein n=1 Tax=Sphingobacterium sp. LRF_L2 TaxID=3369421 RepID=UPI003F5E71EA